MNKEKAIKLLVEFMKEAKGNKTLGERADTADKYAEEIVKFSIPVANVSFPTDIDIYKTAANKTNEFVPQDSWSEGYEAGFANGAIWMRNKATINDR